MAPAVLDTVTVDLVNGDVRFRATGSQVKFPGFMKVYVEGDDDKEEEKDRILPPLEEGEHVKFSRNRSETTLYTAATEVFRSTTCQNT